MKHDPKDLSPATRLLPTTTGVAVSPVKSPHHRRHGRLRRALFAARLSLVSKDYYYRLKYGYELLHLLAAFMVHPLNTPFGLTSPGAVDTGRRRRDQGLEFLVSAPSNETYDIIAHSNPTTPPTHRLTQRPAEIVPSQ